MRIFAIIGSLLNTTLSTVEQFDVVVNEGLSWTDVGINESKKARVETQMTPEQVEKLNKELEKLSQ